MTDLRVGIDWGSSGFQVSPNVPSIAAIERDRVADQKVFLDRPYYRWRISLNAPQGGLIEFGAVGFTQTLREEPTLCREQHLPPAQRGSD